MEDLKRYRVEFKIIFHCIGRKGFFHKKDYPFDFTVEKTSACVNARCSQNAKIKAKAQVKKYVEKFFEETENKLWADNSYIFLKSNAGRSDRYSPKVYKLISADIELVKITELLTWKNQTVNYAMEKLSIEEFKQVYGETAPRQEED